MELSLINNSQKYALCHLVSLQREPCICLTVYQELGLVITGTLPVFNKTKTKDDRNGEVH